MKKPIFALLSASLLLGGLASCKKGENDPALSLKSRKARLTADWTVSSITQTSTSTSTYEDDPNNDGELLTSQNTSTYNMDGGVVSYTNSNTSTYDGDDIWNHESSTSETTASNGTITYTSSDTYGTTTTSYENQGEYSSTMDWTISFLKDGTYEASKTTVETTTYVDDSDPNDVETDVTTETVVKTISGTWAFVGKKQN